MAIDPATIPAAPVSAGRRGWLEFRRPDSRWEAVVRNAPGLAISGALLLASVVLQPQWLPTPLCFFLRDQAAFVSKHK